MVSYRTTKPVAPSAVPDIPMQQRPDAKNPKRTRLFLLLGLGTLDLGGAAEGLLSVLALLACIGRKKDMLAGNQFLARGLGGVAVLSCRGGRENVRCCLLAFSILVAWPTRTSL